MRAQLTESKVDSNVIDDILITLVSERRATFSFVIEFPLKNLLRYSTIPCIPSTYNMHKIHPHSEATEEKVPHYV